MKASNIIHHTKRFRWGRYLYLLVVVSSLVMVAVETLHQVEDTKYLKVLADNIVQQANAVDKRSKVIALRSYLQEHIEYQDAPMAGRPFLRSCAMETLRSGKGYCGEATRAFIRLANTVGIEAQRINLYGKRLHVVAEAELAPGERVIVDCQNPPQVQELIPLDQVMLSPDYDDYSTLNLRRLRLDWLVSRVKLEMGPLTFWAENPHALQAMIWLSIALFFIACKLIWVCGRAAVLHYLMKKGWVRRIDPPADSPVPLLTET